MYSVKLPLFGSKLTIVTPLLTNNIDKLVKLKVYN